MARCWHCKAETPDAHYQRVVYNKTALHGDWTGWRMAGRFLIAPGGQRITPERVRGFLWNEHARGQAQKKAARISGLQTKNFTGSCETISLPARELFCGQA